MLLYNFKLRAAILTVPFDFLPLISELSNIISNKANKNLEASFVDFIAKERPDLIGGNLIAVISNTEKQQIEFHYIHGSLPEKVFEEPIEISLLIKCPVCSEFKIKTENKCISCGYCFENFPLEVELNVNSRH